MKTRVPLALLLVFTSFAVASAQGKTNVRILNQGKTIELVSESIKPLPRVFVAESSKRAASYRLYEVETPDPDKPCVYERCINPLTDFLDAEKPPKCNDENCHEVTLNLRKELPAKGSFLLVVNDFEAVDKPGKISFKADATAEIVGPWDAYRQGREFRVKSNVPLLAATPLKVERTVSRLADDSMNVVETLKIVEATPVNADSSASVMPAAGATLAPKNILSFGLSKKLQEGNEYALTIPGGITTAAGQNVVAKGTLKIPGTPAAPDEPKISSTFSFESAVRQKAVFQWVFNYTPLRNVKAFKWGRKQFYFEPKVTVDIGLRSTKANNSVTVYLPVTANFKLDDAYSCIADPRNPESCKEFKASNIPAYARWARTPWHRFASTKLFLGPKLEFDKLFKRRNVLGSLRLDFNLYRWMGSISHKRWLITQEPPFGIGKDKAGTLEGIDTGFKLTPYLSFDFGGHVNNETVEKELSDGQVLSLVVPRHKILRGYAGFNGAVEWRMFSRPLTLTLDESVVYIAARETIGLTTDTGVEARQLRGFHPHFKTQLDIAIDPAKRYSFNVTYENGRLAPNFEYLNKTSAGIKVKY